MALPRKKLRQITVNNKSYGWIASGNDDHKQLTPEHFKVLRGFVYSISECS